MNYLGKTNTVKLTFLFPNTKSRQFNLHNLKLQNQRITFTNPFTVVNSKNKTKSQCYIQKTCGCHKTTTVS